MFAARYFAPRFYANRYFPAIGLTVAVVVAALRTYQHRLYRMKRQGTR